MPPIELTNKPIVITGASSGIGRATALACARAGMPVVLAARRAERLAEVEQLVAQIPGGRALAVQTDVTAPEQCAALIERGVEAFGGIYAVFANAGYSTETTIVEMPDEELRAIFETNFYGTLNVIRPALEHMRATEGSPRGHVLICSSCVARFALPRIGAYTATKAAQAHIGAAMRVELRDEGIYVSTVHPIGTRTEFFQSTRRINIDEGQEHRAPEMFVQSAELVAGRIVACLRRPRPEVWTGPKGAITRFSAGLMTMFPSLADLIGRRSLHKNNNSH